MRRYREQSKRCADCHQTFKWDRSGHKFSNREYFDHIKTCGLDGPTKTNSSERPLLAWVGQKQVKESGLVKEETILIEDDDSNSPRTCPDCAFVFPKAKKGERKLATREYNDHVATCGLGTKQKETEAVVKNDPVLVKDDDKPTNSVGVLKPDSIKPSECMPTIKQEMQEALMVECDVSDTGAQHHKGNTRSCLECGHIFPWAQSSSRATYNREYYDHVKICGLNGQFEVQLQKQPQAFYDQKRREKREVEDQKKRQEREVERRIALEAASNLMQCFVGLKKVSYSIDDMDIFPRHQLVVDNALHDENPLDILSRPLQSIFESGTNPVKDEPIVIEDDIENPLASKEEFVSVIMEIPKGSKEDCTIASRIEVDSKTFDPTEVDIQEHSIKLESDASKTETIEDIPMVQIKLEANMELLCDTSGSVIPKAETSDLPELLHKILDSNSLAMMTLPSELLEPANTKTMETNDNDDLSDSETELPVHHKIGQQWFEKISAIEAALSASGSGGEGSSSNVVKKSQKRKRFKSREERAHLCPFEGCGKSFARRDEVKRHLWTHTKEERFRCLSCGDGFSRSDRFRDHSARCHGRNLGAVGISLQAEDISEDIEEKIATIAEGIMSNMKDGSNELSDRNQAEKHNSKEDPLPWRFSEQDQIILEMVEDEETTKDESDKGKKSRGAFLEETSEKDKKSENRYPWDKVDGPECPKCGQVCKNNHHLQQHVLSHYYQQFYKVLPDCKPFPCPSCGKENRDRVSLIRHYAFTHNMLHELTDVTPEMINSCGRSRGQFRCHFCGGAFNQAATLRAHNKNCTKKELGGDLGDIAKDSECDSDTEDNTEETEASHKLQESSEMPRKRIILVKKNLTKQ